jgi:hypothetical protein
VRRVHSETSKTTSLKITLKSPTRPGFEVRL